MLVVLDTNVVLRALSSKSDLSVLLDNLFEEKYSLAISTDIILEYEEKISHFYGISVAKDFLDFLILLPNVSKVEPYFELNLITSDPDDNKFVDCAFSANAHYIATDDKHFNILKKLDFPKISTIKAHDFKELISNI